jgi:antitoxin VapB
MRYLSTVSLNIKNPHVHELAREAARRFGMSQTGVIEEALLRMLASQEDRSETVRLARVNKLLADVDGRLTDEQRTVLLRHDDLYDESGLPA